MNSLGLLRNPFEDRGFKPARSYVPLVGMKDTVPDPEAGSSRAAVRLGCIWIIMCAFYVPPSRNVLSVNVNDCT